MAKPKIDYRKRRAILIIIVITALLAISAVNLFDYINYRFNHQEVSVDSDNLAIKGLGQLEIKDKITHIDYQREYFGSGWSVESGCDTRNIILARDLIEPVVDENCQVTSGRLMDPYTGRAINYSKGKGGTDIQIDHVVALKSAWQTGAAFWDQAKREQFANDPMELLAVSGEANQGKASADAADWLPENKNFWCQYIARQVSIKIKYQLWLARSEFEKMRAVLNNCPNQKLLTI